MKIKSLEDIAMTLDKVKGLGFKDPVLKAASDGTGLAWIGGSL